MNPIAVFTKILKQVYDPSLSQTYYPGEKLKSKPAILLDHLMWLAKHKEVNTYYYLYGLDRKNFDINSELIPYKRFMKMRDRKNSRPQGMNFNYAALLRDKFVFGQFLQSLNFPTPKNIALFENDTITWLDDMRTEKLSDISRKDISIDGFCKKLAGLMGEGYFPLKVCGGKIYAGEELISEDQLKSKMKGTYLWQEKIVQCDEMARLYPQSVNTIRLITWNNNGSIEIFACYMRVGANNSTVDNWAVGGIAVSVDFINGKTLKKGLYKPGYGTVINVHPDTGAKLTEFTIPYFHEAVEMTKRLHNYFYGVHSIGWDIAFTPDGPVFVEGNDDWGMSVEENFKNRFLKMYSM